MGESKELQDPCQERGPTCSWEADNSKDELYFSHVGETDVFTHVLLLLLTVAHQTQVAHLCLGLKG